MTDNRFVNLYDENGCIVDQQCMKPVIDDDDINQLPLLHTRVTPSKKFKNIYYKGIGGIYCAHNVNKITDEYKVIQGAKLPSYIKYKVSKKCFEGKIGIFKEKYQPYFSDYIGGCGPKELNIVSNSKEMPNEILGVCVKDYGNLFDDHYYFINEYKNGRQPYVKNIEGFSCFLDFISQGEWYTAWDKNLIHDIDSGGLLQDPADWKKILSDDPLVKFYHTFGTMYSLWFSMYNQNPKSFVEHASIYFPIMENTTNKLVMIPLLVAIVINKFNNTIVPDFYKKSKYGIEDYKCFMRNMIKNNPVCCQLQDYNYSDFDLNFFLKDFSAT